MSSSEAQTLTLETLTLESLIPGLPNDLSSFILSLIPFSHHDRLKPTSKSWHSFLSSQTLFSLRLSSSISLSHILCIFPQDPSLSPPYLFDPLNSAWKPLPPMPCSPHYYGLSNFLSVSLGPTLYVLGGSLFDTRTFPINHPSPSSSLFSLHLPTSSWARLSPMRSPRGSFACAALPSSRAILVAGGGSRHALFGAAGSRMSSVERYDVDKDCWFEEEGLPRFRAGCVGFLVGGEEEFWVMGGYGDCRTVSGVFPVDEYYRDGVVLGLKSGEWREIRDMWEEGERWKLGSVVVVDGEHGEGPGIFMLDGDEIFRFDITSNRWWKETSLPKKSPPDSSCGFVALGGELYVMFASPRATNSTPTPKLMESQRPRQKRVILFIQIYHPKKRKWRFLMTKPPFKQPLDFKSAVMCTIRL
ncbi:galactose oxidase/kelch repeat superfamily protein [Tasmannia lanceolata]|uniref:galactose oxidase/kelch repeat superfamily protein n=1 Tax=Tasmannia lanceolata TaxID=3420 RepID=UPI0040646633